MSRIVVGVDGSPASEAALRWAHEYAERCGGAIEIIMSWNEHPLLAGISETLGGGVPLDQVEAQARALLDATVNAAIPEGSTVTITSSVISGSPGDALVQAAVLADALVVGRPERSGLLNLGSVAAHCARNATCPTVVVPE
jgi:nucleotide-binding universal stress UspA family protein